MNINFQWITKDIQDVEDLNEYCSSEKEVFFCWWLHTEITESGFVYKEISALLIQAKDTKVQYRGDVMWLTISAECVTLQHPRTKVEHHYSMSEFQENMKNWELTLNQ